MLQSGRTMALRSGQVTLTAPVWTDALELIQRQIIMERRLKARVAPSANFPQRSLVPRLFPQLPAAEIIDPTRECQCGTGPLALP